MGEGDSGGGEESCSRLKSDPEISFFDSGYPKQNYWVKKKLRGEGAQHKMNKAYCIRAFLSRYLKMSRGGLGGGRKQRESKKTAFSRQENKKNRGGGRWESLYLVLLKSESEQRGRPGMWGSYDTLDCWE